MANIYDMNAAIDKPNILGAVQQGMQFGQQQRKLREDRADQQQLRNLAPAIMGGDPNAYEQAAVIDTKAAQGYQDAGDSQYRRLKGAVDLVNQRRALAKETGDMRYVNAALREVGPYFSRLIGKPIPPTWTPDMDEGWAQLEARVAMADQKPDQELAPRVVGRSLVDSTGKVLYEAPAEQDYQWSDRAGAWIPKPMAGAGQPAMPQSGDSSVLGEDGSQIPMRTVRGADGQIYRVQIGDPNAAQVGAADMGAGGRAGNVQLPQRDVSPVRTGGLTAIPVAGIGPKEADNVPSGYRPRADGMGLEPIPGGPADKQNNPVAADLAKGEMGMRKELSDRIKPDRQTIGMYTNVQQAAQTPSAAGDLSLIFAYMKMLDPGSVVREQEFANAQNAAGVPDQIRNVFNKVKSGERLNPAQRQDFLQQAANLANAAQQRITAATREFQGIADDYGWDPTRATGMADFRNVTGSVQGQQPDAPRGAGFQIGQIVEAGGKRYRVTGGDPNDPDVEEVQ